MEYIRFDCDVANAAFAGNKAHRLAQLKAAGFRVPAFFVIAAHAAHEICRTALRAEVAGAAAALCADGRRVAVRSSSAEEDAGDRSYAGQFSSFLGIAQQDITDYAYKVWNSASSEHLATYREFHGANGKATMPAVLVQRMVDAEAAGVAFSADPLSGDRDTALVAAIRGVADALVSGERQGDTWHVCRRGKIIAQDLESAAPALTGRQVRSIAKLARAASRYYGKPQDIEWAIENGRIFLLQSRDITTLSRTESHDDYAIWDNSNIVESYGGVTTPLTFSVARSAYQGAYRHFCRMLGISKGEIARHDNAFRQMIGLIQGRVYYNLLNWYRLLMLTPGFRFNRKFMEQMMGVAEGVPQQALPAAGDNTPFASVRATIGLARVARRLVTRMVGHASRVRRFHRELERALEPLELASLRLDELFDSYEALENKVIPAWDTPLINDLYCMMFHGALRALCGRWLGDDLAGIHNELVSGEAGMISLEPVRRMQRMAAIAAADAKLANALRSASNPAALRLAGSNKAFRLELDAYLERFGDRCLDELKLESETLADNPEPLFRAVGQLAQGLYKRQAEAAGDGPRAVAEAQVAARLKGSPLRRLLLAAVLRLARARVRDRENLRFERTRVYGRVRAIFLEIGARLNKLGVLEKHDDVFYLSVEEIAGFIRGTGCATRLADLVACRRGEFAAYANSEGPPRRFVTRGPAQLPSSIQAATPAAEQTDEASRSGQACSPGIVRGPVRIVRDPRTSKVRQGDILVAERTDPGWVMIFPLLKGMIMERGSLLSHSAIVARELAIPAVVGVGDACRWLRDGDWVELDGARGLVRKLEPRDRAA